MSTGHFETKVILLEVMIRKPRQQKASSARKWRKKKHQMEVIDSETTTRA
jgi:hypothetical protein